MNDERERERENEDSVELPPLMREKRGCHDETRKALRLATAMGLSCPSMDRLPCFADSDVREWKVDHLPSDCDTHDHNRPYYVTVVGGVHTTRVFVRNLTYWFAFNSGPCRDQP